MLCHSQRRPSKTPTGMQRRALNQSSPQKLVALLFLFLSPSLTAPVFRNSSKSSPHTRLTIPPHYSNGHSSLSSLDQDLVRSSLQVVHRQTQLGQHSQVDHLCTSLGLAVAVGGRSDGESLGSHSWSASDCDRLRAESSRLTFPRLLHTDQ